MANKGLQFEHAVMYVAASRVTNRTTETDAAYADASKHWSGIPADVKQKAEEIVTGMAPQNLNDAQAYYKSFKKMSGGGEEPKTDIMFVLNNQKYRCSMKWGKSYQLTSAGVDRSLTVFTNVLKKVAREYSTKSDAVTLGYLQLLLEQLGNKLDGARRTMPAPQAKALMGDLKKSEGLNEQLQMVLGSKKNPRGDEVYRKFKYELTKECMTGEMLFGRNDDRTATHLFTENGIKPIDDKAITEVMNMAGVRISLKGRGTNKITGVRNNAISIRYEV